jgi:PPP family 3-phenylpropionic acid transporter
MSKGLCVMVNQLYILRGLNFSYYSTQAILLPFLPLYFLAKGLTMVEIGFLMTIGPFVAIFAQPMWGYISDRFKTVKSVILLLWILTILSSVGLFMADHFVEYFIYVLLLFFFMMPSMPLLDSISIKVTESRGASYGSVRLWGSVGFTVTAVVSGLIMASIGGIENIRLIYWSIWILPMILIIFLRDEPAPGVTITAKAVYSIFRNRQFLWFLLLVFILMMPHRLNDSLFGVYLGDLGASDKMIGLAWALAAVSEVPTFAILGRYLHRFHELALLSVVSFLYVIRWILYGMISDPGILMYLQASHSITFAVFWIVAIQYVVRLVPKELRSTGQSFFSAVFIGLAGISGGLVGGALNEQFGGASMYYFGAVMALIGGILFLLTHAYNRKRI